MTKDRFHWMDSPAFMHAALVLCALAFAAWVAGVYVTTSADPALVQAQQDLIEDVRTTLGAGE